MTYNKNPGDPTTASLIDNDPFLFAASPLVFWPSAFGPHGSAAPPPSTIPFPAFVISSSASESGPGEESTRESEPSAESSHNATMSEDDSPSGGVTNEQFAKILRGISGMAINDVSFAPKPFTGTPADEDVDTWLKQLEGYVEFRALDVATKLQLFKMLLKGLAAEWLRSLPNDTTNDYNSLVDAFRERFALSDVQLCQKASHMWGREQQSSETVDAYVSDIRKTARQLQMTDESMLRFAVIRGLRPAIRLHVLQSNATTLEEVIKAARTAEAANQSVPDSSSAVTELTSTVKQLVEAMKSSPTIASASESVTVVSNERMDRRSTSPRRVRFEPSTSVANTSGDRTYGRHQPTEQYNGGRFNNRRSYPRGNNTYRPSGNSAYDCRNCSRQHTAGLCAARNVQCFNCSKRGHFARACRSGGSGASFQQQQQQQPRQPQWYNY